MVKRLSFPEGIRDEVLRELYRQANGMDWELLSGPQKSQQYAEWINQPAIGGKLTRFHAAEDVRVWLKDVPMKEYARALDGFSLFAQYTTKQLSGIDEMVRRALGHEWHVVPDSRGEKPLNCLVSNGNDVRYVCWGKPGTFRDLVWAALNKAVDLDHQPMIIVTTRDGQDVNGEERRRQERIARHCQVGIRYVHRRLVDRVD